MNIINNSNLKSLHKNHKKVGNILFFAGVFFLPSALPIGGFFLLISIFIAFNTNKIDFFKNKWDLSFFISGILIILSAFYNSILNPDNALLNFNNSTIWLNLFNWIPIYFAYLGFQVYLKNEKQRLLFQKVLIAGTVPVILSCIMQYIFKIYGPFETLFGTIVWFNYNFSEKQYLRASGLFNNPNYLGMWLTLCLPFALSALKSEKNNLLNKLTMYLINFFIVFFAFATYSRNAVLGIFISFLFLIERRKLIYFFSFSLISVIIFSMVLPNFVNIFGINFENFLQADIVQKFSSFQFSFNNPRITIWSNSLNFISMRPLMGWGAGSFPLVFYENAYLETPIIKYQHTHNLILELAYNFGIPIAILILSTVISLFLNAIKKLNSLNKSLSSYQLYNPLIASFSIFLLAHFTDITYYDGKISILFSLLLAGIKNIADESIKLKDSNKVLIK